MTTWARIVPSDAAIRRLRELHEARHPRKAPRAPSVLSPDPGQAGVRAEASGPMRSAFVEAFQALGDHRPPAVPPIRLADAGAFRRLLFAARALEAAGRLPAELVRLLPALAHVEPSAAERA
jgi:hypothetical protein